MDTLQLFQRATSPGTNYTSITNYRNQCTLDTCPLSDSYFAYRPSLAANALFLALFAFSLICFILQVLLSRRFIGFTIALVSGCVLEVVGYAGRLMSWKNPFDQVASPSFALVNHTDVRPQNGFLIQIVCLTIAPAFMAAGLYLTLSRIVRTFGPENSRIAPLSYPRIFIPCDIVSLLLQAIGGGMASVASHQDKSPDNGDHIMVSITLETPNFYFVAFVSNTYTGCWTCLSSIHPSCLHVSLRRLRRQNVTQNPHNGRCCPGPPTLRVEVKVVFQGFPFGPFSGQVVLFHPFRIPGGCGGGGVGGGFDQEPKLIYRAGGYDGHCGGSSPQCLPSWNLLQGRI